MNGEVRHRRRLIWLERQHLEGAQGENQYELKPLHLGDAEHAVQVRLEPVRRLVAAALRDPDFLAGLEKVATGETKADRLANRYVKRGKGQDRAFAGMVAFIERAAEGGVLGVAASGAAVKARIDIVPEWTHAQRHREAAAMLMARGSSPRRCMRITERPLKNGGVEIGICRQVLSYPTPEQRHCVRHLAGDNERLRKLDRSDRDAISSLLRAVAHALNP